MLNPKVQSICVPLLIDSIGNTPLVDISMLTDNPGVRLLAKLEGNNPGGSVKDRPALYMINKAEESGELTPDKIILEPTSGNTGIAIAMIGAAKGYRVKLVMPLVSVVNGAAFWKPMEQKQCFPPVVK